MAPLSGDETSKLKPSGSSRLHINGTVHPLLLAGAMVLVFASGCFLGLSINGGAFLKPHPGAALSEEHRELIVEALGNTGGTTTADGLSLTPPATLLDVSGWVLQLPCPMPGVPTVMQTVFHPQLDTFVQPTNFFASGNKAVFVTNAGGLTTPNSEYPRSELAQTNPDGSDSTWTPQGQDINSITWSGAVQRLTPVRPQVVIGQILTVGGPLLQIRIKGAVKGKNVIIAQFTGSPNVDLTTDYQLGTQYTITISAGQGKVSVSYEDTVKKAVAFLTSTSTPCYFKLGNYLQSNPSVGENPSATSEVWVYSLQLTNSGSQLSTSSAGNSAGRLSTASAAHSTEGLSGGVTQVTKQQQAIVPYLRPTAIFNE